MKRWNKMKIDDQDKLIENIQHVQGIFELLYNAVLSKNPISSEGGILTVVADAQNKMEEIKKSVDILTSA